MTAQRCNDGRAAVLFTASCVVLVVQASVRSGSARRLQATNSTAVLESDESDEHDAAFWLVVGVFGLRLSEFLVGAARRRLCPERKAIVMSCPERGTLSPDGLPPYDQPVMERVAELQRRGRLKMCFDRAGSSTTHAEDRDVDWTNSEHIRRSQWMYGFRTAAKKVIAIECQGFSGIVVVVCIKGGAVTDVEHEEMDSIVADAKSDAGIS